jgi:hypothetical protein
MKKEIKERINALHPEVRKKLLRRLAAENLAKKLNLEIDFSKINQDDYIEEINKAKVNQDKKLTELQKKAILVKLINSKPPQDLIERMNSKKLNNED